MAAGPFFFFFFSITPCRNYHKSFLEAAGQRLKPLHPWSLLRLTRILNPRKSLSDSTTFPALRQKQEGPGKMVALSHGDSSAPLGAPRGSTASGQNVALQPPTSYISTDAPLLIQAGDLAPLPPRSVSLGVPAQHLPPLSPDIP